VADTDVFQAIAHPARRALLDALRGEERPVRDLAALFDSTRPATSQHLRLLLSAGLVGERAAGRENLYRLTPQPLVEVSHWVGFYEEFWNGRLRELRSIVEGLE
jgi:DNA-binding transcriptional ArsR family regulator